MARPGSVDQAQLLTPVFEAGGAERVITIALDVPEAEVRQRLAERGKREGRADDAPEIISQRFGVWAATGSALLAWYERDAPCGGWHGISGRRGVEGARGS